MDTAGIYIHIPFCLKKCFYCDFFSIASDVDYIRKGYTRALLKEIGFYGAKYGKDFVADTIFFGGGTPSLNAGFSGGAGVRIKMFDVGVSVAKYHPSALSMMLSISTTISDF